MNINLAIAAFLLVCPLATADDPPVIPAKPIAEKKELLFSDDFEGPSPPRYGIR